MTFFGGLEALDILEFGDCTLLSSAFTSYRNVPFDWSTPDIIRVNLI
jgi:hypothetical protein